MNALLAQRLQNILEELAKQTAILERMADQQLTLIQELAEDEPEDPDAQPRKYMDGSRMI